MQDTIYKQATGLVAVLLIAILVAPAAFANAGEVPRATSSAAKVGKTLQKLKTQLAVLRQQVKALEGQNGGPRTPSGAAGGDLTGVYPNPLIGPNAVGALEIQTDAVGAEELQNNAVGTGEIQNQAVGGSKIATGSVSSAHILDEGVVFADVANGAISGVKIADNGVFADDLAVDSVGSSELQPLTAHVSAGVAVSAGAPQDASVTCPEGRTLIAGGHAWFEDEANSIIVSAPSETDPTSTWVVRGAVDSGSNTLFAWATCLKG